MSETNPFLFFALETTPLQVEVNSQPTLTFIGNNQNPDPGTNVVVLKQVVILLPIGSDADALTIDIPTATPPDTTWSSTSGPANKKGFQQYTFTPKSGTALVGIQPLQFTFDKFTVNGDYGSVTMCVEQTAVEEAQPQDQPITMVKAPEGWSEVSFQPTLFPPIVQSGVDSGLQLKWSGPAGATYQIAYVNGQEQEVTIPSGGQPPLSNQGVYPGQSDPALVLYQTTTFTLTVSMDIDGTTISEPLQTTVTVE